MTKLIKESFHLLQPILTQVADRCINQITMINQSKITHHLFEVERAKRELISLLVHIGSKPTEKVQLKQYISDLVPGHFLKIIHPVQLTLTASSIIESLKEVSNSHWDEQTERDWRHVFHNLADIISEEFLQKNLDDFELDEAFAKPPNRASNKHSF